MSVDLTCYVEDTYKVNRQTRTHDDKYFTHSCPFLLQWGTNWHHNLNTATLVTSKHMKNLNLKVHLLMESF